MKHHFMKNLWMVTVITAAMTGSSSDAAHASPLLTRDQAVRAALEVGTNDFRISDMGSDVNASFDGGPSAVAYNPQTTNT